MDNAKNILQKYGWKEGKGLGKDETGISKPLRCGLKFDKCGIGYNEKVSKEENNQWWIQMFNQAAANISTVEKTTTKVDDHKKLTGKILTDEELFQACGGRTAHKAARHGLRLSGKLKRVNQQESMNGQLDVPAENALHEQTEVPEKKKSKRANLVDNSNTSAISERPQSIRRKKKKSRLIEESGTPTGVNDGEFPIRTTESSDRIIEGQSEEKVIYDNQNVTENDCDLVCATPKNDVNGNKKCRKNKSKMRNKKSVSTE